MPRNLRYNFLWVSLIRYKNTFELIKHGKKTFVIPTVNAFRVKWEIYVYNIYFIGVAT